VPKSDARGVSLVALSQVGGGSGLGKSVHLKGPQCGFDSHRGHQPVARSQRTSELSHGSLCTFSPAHAPSHGCLCTSEQARHTGTFACPVCGVTPHRRFRDPGYSQQMIAARGDFFDAGHYAPLADGVAERRRAALPVGETAKGLRVGSIPTERVPSAA